MTLWAGAHQGPLSMRFSRQEYRSGVPFPTPVYLPHPGIEPGSPASAGESFTTEPPGKLNTVATQAETTSWRCSDPSALYPTPPVPLMVLRLWEEPVQKAPMDTKSQEFQVHFKSLSFVNCSINSPKSPRMRKLGFGEGNSRERGKRERVRSGSIPLPFHCPHPPPSPDRPTCPHA